MKEEKKKEKGDVFGDVALIMVVLLTCLAIYLHSENTILQHRILLMEMECDQKVENSNL